MANGNVYRDYERWEGYTRRAKPGQGDAFEAFGHDLATYTSHQHTPWVERKEPFDASHCEECAQRLWKLSNQYEQWSMLHALTNFPFYMGHEQRGLEEREARFLLELLTVPEIDALVQLASREQRQTMHEQWSAHVEVAIERSSTPWSREVLRQHLYRFLRAEDLPNAHGYRNAHSMMSRSAACVFSWVRYAYGIDLAMELCFELMHKQWLGWGLHNVGSTRGYEARAIELLHASQIDLDALVSKYPEKQEVINIARILERCPDQVQIYEWSPIIVEHCKTSSTDNGPEQDHVLFALEDYKELMESLKEYRITLFMRDVWLIYGRYGEACLEDLSALIMSRANGARRNELLKALWPVCDERLTPLMLDASLKVESAEVATWWLTRQGADATLGLMRQARRRGKIGHQARTMLEQIVAEGHGEEVRALLPLLDDPKLVSHIKEEILANAPSEDASPDTTRDDVTELDHFPEVLAALDAHPIGGGDPEAREAFLRGLDHVLHLDRAPALRVKGDGEQVASRELVARMLWCIALAWPLDRRKGKKGKEREAREARQESLRATLPHVRDVFNEEDLAALTRHIFEAWWAHEQPAEQMWCIWTLGYCGGEDEALWMREKMRSMNRWFPGSQMRQSTRDVIGALAVMGTPMSRMMLDVLREEGRNELITSSAQEARAELCARHGWDANTWEDVSVPTAGLDPAGKRRFDYGARHFDLVFRGAFEIGLLDEKGKLHSRLPAIRKSDDQGMAQEARQMYKEVSEQLTLVVERQRYRLDQWLSEQHGWTPEAWHERVASHPLMRHFARMLIWKVVRDEMVEGVVEERIEALFLWTEEGEAMGVDYERLSWEELAASGERVRLMHPCDLSEQELARWSQLLTEFEVVQPVRQIERSRHGFEEGFDEALGEALRQKEIWRMYDLFRHRRAWRSAPGERQRAVVLWTDWGRWRVLWTHGEEGWGEAKKRRVVERVPEETRSGLSFMGLDEAVSKPGRLVPRERVPAWLVAEVRASFQDLVMM